VALRALWWKREEDAGFAGTVSKAVKRRSRTLLMTRMLADQDPSSEEKTPGGWRLGRVRTQLHANNPEFRQFWKGVLGVVGGHQSHLAKRTEANEARGWVILVVIGYPRTEWVPEPIDVLEMVAQCNGGAVA
jgi:hypothetical protein